MGKRVALRRADACAGCAIPLGVGTAAWWDAGRRVVHCDACGPPTDAVADVQDGIEPSPAPAPLIDPGTAGGSARREYERRAAREQADQEAAVALDAAWRERVRAEHRIVGRLVTSLAPKPVVGVESQATTAWKTGAAGEERVAEVLDACAGIIALHDRRIPGTRANIDHLAVTPAGVWVIDAKRYTGRLERRDLGGLFRTDERLFIAGRDRTKLVAGVAKQCEVVRAALRPRAGSVEVSGILCFVGAEWPGWRPKPLRVDGMVCTWPNGLADLLRRAVAGPATIDVLAVGTLLAQALPLA